MHWPQARGRQAPTWRGGVSIGARHVAGVCARNLRFISRWEQWRGLREVFIDGRGGGAKRWQRWMNFQFQQAGYAGGGMPMFPYPMQQQQSAMQGKFP